MARRRRRGRQAVRTHSRHARFPTWLGALLGVVIGVGIVLILIHHAQLPMHASNGPHPNPGATASHAGEDGLVPFADAPKKPKYDFYSVLSQKEVRIPDAEISAKAKAEKQHPRSESIPAQTGPPPPEAISQNIAAAPASSASVKTSNTYQLQVGAFPKAAEAEALKPRLALRGFMAHVQSIDLDGCTYYRVRLGPYHSAMTLEAEKQRLKASGFKAVALKEGS